MSSIPCSPSTCTFSCYYHLSKRWGSPICILPFTSRIGRITYSMRNVSNLVPKLTSLFIQIQVPTAKCTALVDYKPQYFFSSKDKNPVHRKTSLQPFSKTNLRFLYQNSDHPWIEFINHSSSFHSD